jgi:hypothetical protein
VATQPFSKVRRALQTSSTPPMTDTPVASTLATGLLARFSTMSMSWIMTSSTTPTSIDRNVSGLTRVTSMNRGRTSSRDIARTTGLNRSMCPTCTGVLC